MLMMAKLHSEKRAPKELVLKTMIFMSINDFSFVTYCTEHDLSVNTIYYILFILFVIIAS